MKFSKLSPEEIKELKDQINIKSQELKELRLKLKNAGKRTDKELIEEYRSRCPEADWAIERLPLLNETAEEYCVRIIQRMKGYCKSPYAYQLKMANEYLQEANTYPHPFYYINSLIRTHDPVILHTQLYQNYLMHIKSVMK